MKQINFIGFAHPKQIALKKSTNNFRKLQKGISLFVIFLLTSAASFAQIPAYGVTGFNNPVYDQVPFAAGTAYPSVMTAANVESTGWSFHIGAIGAYTITQLNQGSGTYNGAIVANNVTPFGFPTLYQTFAFTSTNNSMFKLNSVKVKVSNSSMVPIPMLLAGVINGANTGSTIDFLAMPGSNWVTLTTSANNNFANINGVISINVTGSTAIAEMAFDDINISAPNPLAVAPVFTLQPTNKTVCAGTSTAFTSTVTGAATYFWLISTDGLIWNPITSANAGTFFTGYNTPNLTVTNPSVALNNLYLGVTAVSSLGVNKGSNAVRLFVNAVPNVPAIAGATSVCKNLTTTLTNALTGGVWSSLNINATISSVGVVTGANAGTAVIKYTVSNAGCSSYATYNVTVNSNLVIPSIGYAVGTVNPQTGAGGGFCTNRSFTLVGSPSGGSWSSTGVISVSGSGTVTTGLIPGAGSVTYSYNNAAGCRNSRSITGTIVTCAARGVNTNASTTNSSSISNELFTVFPNPAKNKININADFVTAGGQIVITNLMGKQTKTQALSVGNNNIDISTLSKGFYLVSVITSEGKKTQKLIVE